MRSHFGYKIWMLFLSNSRIQFLGPYFIIIFCLMSKSDIQEQNLGPILDLHISKVSEEGTLWTLPITDL